MLSAVALYDVSIFALLFWTASGWMLSDKGVREMLFGDIEFSVFVFKFVCVVGGSVGLFAYTCWKLCRHEGHGIPVREKEKWEIAFENWLRERGGSGYDRL